jgi:Zn-dependent metalloprotease
MAIEHPNHPMHCIIPPHMLEHISENGSRHQREKAHNTLTVDRTVRQQRVVEGLQPGTKRGGRAPQASQDVAKTRHIYDAKEQTDLPGDLVRDEGAGPTSDPAVDEAYDYMGATWDLYQEVFGRNSWDNAGGDLIGSVHFDHAYDNAFWDGSQMVYGDGDGELFNRFTISVDVIGHELTHGVTQNESGLEYQGQSGALNESLSDVFGSLVKQHAASPQQTADVADWLIGEGLFTAAVQGVALRSMKAPGTAYDDDVLGKDPQPAHMDDYVNTSSDNGGVHINSGIPNHAFYLFAVAVGGYAWGAAGKVWYDAATDDSLSSSADFQAFADKTYEHVGDAEKAALVKAWGDVGITVGGNDGNDGNDGDSKPKVD